ncbi:MAG: histidine kinase N-terminal 7TM domain-containing protein [Halobacteriales archaeon]
MGWSPTLYSFLGLGAAGVSTAVAAQAWRNRSRRGARSFVALMMALAGWSLVYAVQLGFPTAAGQLPWQRVSLAVGGTIPTLWLVFMLRYAGRDDWLTRRRQALLAVDPVLFGALTLTNPVHELIWDSATLTPTQVSPALDLSLELGYYVHISYAYLIIAVGLGLTLLMFERAAPIYRGQSSFLVLGVLPPFVGNIAYSLRLSWSPLPAVDPTPFLFVFTGVLWALAFYQFDLLERTPLARRRVIDEMGDGIVVLDADGEVVNANRTATDALDSVSGTGRSITALPTVDGSTVDATREALEGRTVTATINGRQRAYDIEWSSLTDDRGEAVGYVIALRDVTDRNEYQQRLEVAQRMLRHNLRNDMNLIRGWAGQLAKTATDEQATTVQQIRDTADELIDLSEKTQTMVRLESPTPAERTRVDVRENLTSIVEEFSGVYQDARIECSVGDGVEASLPGDKFLRIPIVNVLENAIEHNDVDDPWVRVSAESIDGGITVSVEDNGPEIPEMEREVLEKGTEDPLHHGSGLGLWLTYWSVRTVGGNIEFDRREPRGNVVTLEFPAAE